jgi:hypothetical protein
MVTETVRNVGRLGKYFYLWINFLCEHSYSMCIFSMSCRHSMDLFFLWGGPTPVRNGERLAQQRFETHSGKRLQYGTERLTVRSRSRLKTEESL